METRTHLATILLVATTLVAGSVTGPAAAAAYWHTELTGGPGTMALWHFNEGSGAVTHDSAGSVDNAAYLYGGAAFASVGVTDHDGLHTAADFGYALQLDGSTAFALVADGPEIEFGTVPLTVEFWVKPQAQEFCRFLSKYGASPGNPPADPARSWEVYMMADSYLQVGDGKHHLVIRFGPGGESTQVSKASIAPLTIDKWQFVAVSFDTGGAPHIFINGVESELKNLYPYNNFLLSVSDSVEPLTIGAFGAGAGNLCAGLIDEVRLTRADVVSSYWHKELTASEKTTALWHFNEGTGTTANDAAGAVNNSCSLLNGAVFASVGVTDHDGLHEPVDFGYALSLDGTNDFGRVMDDPESEFPEVPLTVEFWLKPQAPAATKPARILSKGSTTAKSWNIYMGDETVSGVYDGQHRLLIQFIAPDAKEVHKVVATPIELDKWQFFSVLFDAGGLAHVYVNGRESELGYRDPANLNDVISGVVDKAEPLHMGSVKITTSTNTNYYKGLIDEVRLTRGDTVTGGPTVVSNLSELRGLAERTNVALRDKVVTRQYTDSSGNASVFYVEEADRSSGVRVAYPTEGYASGDGVNVVGTVALTPSDEVYVNAVKVVKVDATDPIGPLAMNTRAVAGDPLGQGPPNRGLLGKIAGKVTYVEGNSEHFWLDDGAALDDGSGHLGVRASSPRDPNNAFAPVAPALDSLVTVTGAISSYKGAEWSGVPRCYDFRLNQGGAVNFRAGQDESRPIGVGFASEGTVPLNQWTHVAVVCDGTMVYLYINGQMDPNCVEAQLPAAPLIPCYVGIYEDNTGKPGQWGSFDGVIDELRFSSVARSFSGPPAGPYTPDADTIALYHFDEGSGNVATNAAGDPTLNGELGDTVKPAWTTGMFGGGLDLLGGTWPNESWVRLPAHPALSLTDGAYTIELWAYVRDYSKPRWFVAKYGSELTDVNPWTGPQMLTGLMWVHEDVTPLQ